MDDGGAGIVQSLEELHDLFALNGVEVAGRLIGEKELWILDDRASHTNELLLPARKLIGEKIFFADDVETIESVADEAGALFVGDILVGEGDFEIFVDREIVDEVVALENEADVVLVQFVALLGVEFVDRLIEEKVFTGPGAVEHAEDAKERGLSCPGRAHDGDKLAGLDVQGDAAKNEEFVRSGLEGLLDVFQLDEGLHVCSLSIRSAGRSLDRPWRLAAPGRSTPAKPTSAIWPQPR